MENTTLFDEYGNFLGSIPDECVNDCSMSGDVTQFVRDWVTDLNFHVPADLARDYLQEFGAWDDLDTCDQNTLDTRCLWIACGDIKESGEWFGLMH